MQLLLLDVVFHLFHSVVVLFVARTDSHKCSCLNNGNVSSSGSRGLTRCGWAVPSPGGPQENPLLASLGSRGAASLPHVSSSISTDGKVPIADLSSKVISLATADLCFQGRM